MFMKDNKTKIFLDSGDPEETKDILKRLHKLDGQTTNPTLISRNPYAKEKLVHGDKFTEHDIWDFYQKVVREISVLLPGGSVSIEVYADRESSAEKMLEQARRFNTWIPNAHIKFPVSEAGLAAAQAAVSEGIRVNLTLVFTQRQAAAVYAATRGAKPGQVYVSPFVGRLDDQGERGTDLIKNILEMYKQGDGHVQVLAASIRTKEHLKTCLNLKSDIVTVPYKILKEWSELSLKIFKSNETTFNDLKEITYEQVDLSDEWSNYDISHPLTEKGIEQFSEDWNALIQ